MVSVFLDQSQRHWCYGWAAPFKLWQSVWMRLELALVGMGMLGGNGQLYNLIMTAHVLAGCCWFTVPMWLATLKH